MANKTAKSKISSRFFQKFGRVSSWFLGLNSNKFTIAPVVSSGFGLVMGKGRSRWARGKGTRWRHLWLGLKHCSGCVVTESFVSLASLVPPVGGTWERESVLGRMMMARAL